MTKEKYVSFRVTEKMADAVKSKHGEDSIEYTTLQMVINAKVPMPVMVKLLKLTEDKIRNILLCKEQGDEDEREKIYGLFRRLTELGLKIGVLPTHDKAVVFPIYLMLVQNIYYKDKAQV